jgi:NTP pyrophosphatase (non-canonical NTP hydrolase)
MSINDTARQHHAWLVEMGWATASTPLEQIALIASEIGEAANECRGAVPTEKLGSELADIVLRTLGLAERLGINMEAEIAAKMAINLERGTRGRLK